MLALDFMRQALVAAVLVGIAAPMIGVFLVQRQMSLIGDGIGHVALAGVAAGFLTGTMPLVTALIAAVAAGAAIKPELLMIPAAICASCAFMLPVATAPNAIVFGSGEVSMPEMVRQGAVLSFLVALLVATVCWWLLA